MAGLNLIDKAINFVAPQWGVERATARHKLEQIYQAGQTSRSSVKKSVDQGNADYSTRVAGLEIARNAREIEQNYDIASGALDIFESRVVGRLLQTEPMVRDTDGNLHTALNQQIKQHYLSWLGVNNSDLGMTFSHHSNTPDISGELSAGKLQRLGVRTWIRDGEFVVRLLEGDDYPHHTDYPLSLELMECDQLPHDLNRHPAPAQNPIIQGVEKGAFNIPLYFHVLPYHPGDNYRFVNQSDAIAIPASQILHPKLTNRFGQTRGVSLFHSTFKRIDDIRDYEDAERIAAKMAAAVVMQLVTDKDADIELDPLTPNQQNLLFKPAMIFKDLNKGQKLELINPTRPSPELEQFVSFQYRSVGRGLRISYSDLLGIYDGSYSSERQAQTVTYLLTEPVCDEYVNQFWHPVYARLVQVLFLYGYIDLPNPAEVDYRTLLTAEHRSPVQPHIDPQKESNAAVTDYQYGFDSQDNIMRKRGRNPDVVRSEIARGQEKNRQLDLVFPMTGAESSATED